MRRSVVFCPNRPTGDGDAGFTDHTTHEWHRLRFVRAFATCPVAGVGPGLAVGDVKCLNKAVRLCSFSYVRKPMSAGLQERQKSRCLKKELHSFTSFCLPASHGLCLLKLPTLCQTGCKLIEERAAQLDSHREIHCTSGSLVAPVANSLQQRRLASLKKSILLLVRRGRCAADVKMATGISDAGLKTVRCHYPGPSLPQTCLGPLRILIMLVVKHVG